MEFLYNHFRLLDLDNYLPMLTHIPGRVLMPRMNRTFVTFGMALLFSSSLIVVGCSSSPDEEEMKQLNDLKEEYAALQKEAADKEAQKSALDKEIAEKNAKIKKCNDDQQVVRQRLGQ